MGRKEDIYILVSCGCVLLFYLYVYVYMYVYVESNRYLTFAWRLVLSNIAVAVVYHMVATFKSPVLLYSLTCVLSPRHVGLGREGYIHLTITLHYFTLSLVLWYVMLIVLSLFLYVCCLYYISVMCVWSHLVMHGTWLVTGPGRAGGSVGSLTLTD